MTDKSKIEEWRIRLRYKNDGKEKDTRMTDKRKRQEWRIRVRYKNNKKHIQKLLTRERY